MAEENITQKDKDAVKAMEDQSTATELPEGTKIEPEDQEVQTDELLTTADKKIDAPTKVETPDAIASTDQELPEAFDPASYAATQKADQVGEAKAAKGELSEGSIMTAAQGVVSEEALAEAATQELDPRATTQYQLAELFKGIEEGGPPPAWAAPAVRRVTAMMKSRNLGKSSMAAAATMQAMMESGIPIAAQDAQKYATIQLQNLNNEQQAALQNAAAVLQMDMANLNNRQQAQVQNAKTFLQMDMANLDNEQMNAMFQSQSIVNSLFSDTAAENAAKQFNATSQMQTDQFFSNLSATVSQFNTEQMNGMARFNAGEANALGQFNAGQQNLRDQFNANNHLVIAQANAQWAQSVTTAENAAQNQANRDAAMAANNLTRAAYDAVLQMERDIMGWAWRSAESAADRDANIAVAKISANGKGADAFEAGLGTFVGKLTDKALDTIFQFS